MITYETEVLVSLAEKLLTEAMESPPGDWRTYILSLVQECLDQLEAQRLAREDAIAQLVH